MLASCEKGESGTLTFLCEKKSGTKIWQKFGAKIWDTHLSE